jgi:putative transposase
LKTNQRVEKHNLNNEEFVPLCHKAKNLYNYSNYILRQVFTGKLENIPDYIDLVKTTQRQKTLKDGTVETKIYNNISEYDLTQRMAKINQFDFRELPTQTAQQIIKLLYKNWKAFFCSIREYAKNPQVFLGKPKPPKYKDKKGLSVAIFTNQQAKLKAGYICFPKALNLPRLKTGVASFSQVRIIPQATCFRIEIIHEKGVELHELNQDLFLAIDLGLNNLATCIDNSGNEPFIVNGRIIKSINQFYNKTKARLMGFVGKRGYSNRIGRLTHKRNMKIEDQLHKASRFIIDYCLANKIGEIIIGYNPEWKQEINLRSKTNQNFVCIPHAKFTGMIRYKAEDVGIKTRIQEESYTSKCDSLALEPISRQNEYLGQRIKRGLFKSSTGKVLNADVNGALNILRKAVGESVARQIVNRGIGFMPNRCSVY